MTRQEPAGDVGDRGGRHRLQTGVRQEEYVKAALDVLSVFKEKTEFLGLSLWQLSRWKKADEPEKVRKRTKMPDYVRSTVWKLLEKF